ncbi:RICIN domain-containing protein [Streptomyces sp. NPDC050423]|uniref:RICIN domain-containing protein n=1 Tax=Streptomyces sp. NPDC050423 TaxID=3155402 RepID=UPI00343805CE
MRKAFALAIAGISLIGAFAAAPNAAASAPSPGAPAPVVTTFDTTAPVPEWAHSLSDKAGTTRATAGIVAVWDKNFLNKRDNTKCLDDSTGNGLRVHTCNTPSFNNGFQKFTAVMYDDSYINFQNAATGECLDGSTAHGVRTHTCSSASYVNGYQRWFVNDQMDVYGWVSYRNVATGKCLDYSPAHGLRLHDCSRAALENGYQGWNF